MPGKLPGFVSCQESILTLKNPKETNNPFSKYKEIGRKKITSFSFEICRGLSKKCLAIYFKEQNGQMGFGHQLFFWGGGEEGKRATRR